MKLIVSRGKSSSGDAQVEGHLIDWNLCHHQMVKASTIEETSLRIASGHAKISRIEAVEIIGMSHLEIECTRLHTMSKPIRDATPLAR